MKYRFIFTAWFDRDLKLLGRHNPNLRSDVEAFLHGFDPTIHPLIPGTGGARKARMAARAKGKRGGYRVVYFFFVENTVWLITMYDKVSKENLSPAEEREIHRLIREIKNRS